MNTFLILAGAARVAAQKDPATGVKAYMDLAIKFHEGIQSKKKKKPKPYRPYGYD